MLFLPKSLASTYLKTSLRCATVNKPSNLKTIGGSSPRRNLSRPRLLLFIPDTSTIYSLSTSTKPPFYPDSPDVCESTIYILVIINVVFYSRMCMCL